MSARTIRRTFAVPVVITLSSCTPMHTSNPPPPHTVDPHGVEVQPSNGTRRWAISHKPGGQPAECIAQVVVQCPKNAKCLPPQQQDYACPESFGADEQMTIVLHAGQSECFVDYGDMSCPENATCNPPPPRSLPCPK